MLWEAMEGQSWHWPPSRSGTRVHMAFRFMCSHDLYVVMVQCILFCLSYRGGMS